MNYVDPMGSGASMGGGDGTSVDVDGDQDGISINHGAKDLNSFYEALLEEDEATFIDSIPSNEEQWIKLYKGVEKDVLTYIGGYIIKKLPQCEIGIAMESEWIDVVSDGGLRKPSQALVAKMMALEQVFNDFMGDKVDSKPKILHRLVFCERSTMIEPNEKVRRLFFKCRIFARIKTLNEEHIKYLHVTKPKSRTTVT